MNEKDVKLRRTYTKPQVVEVRFMSRASLLENSNGYVGPVGEYIDPVLNSQV